MSMNFVAKIVPGKGPEPIAEIEAIVASSAAHEKGRAVVGTRSAGAVRKGANSGGFAVVFTENADGTLDGFAAELLHKRASAPVPLPPIYASWAAEMAGWWTLKGVRRFLPGHTLDSIPGASERSQTRAEKNFRSGVQTSFAYWTFDEDPREALCGPATE
jgi:hypothetical protein